MFVKLHNLDHVVADFSTITHVTLYTGCPVAWLISNREDEVTLAMFFKVIKERCPEAKVTTLMSDNGELCCVVLALRFVKCLLLH